MTSAKNKSKLDSLDAEASHNLTTSDGGHKQFMMQGAKKASQNASKLTVFTLCLLYGVTSSGFTFVNKQVYETFGDVSPMVLLMIQCLFNVLACLALMTIKEVNVSSLSFLKRYGIVVPELNKMADKF